MKVRFLADADLNKAIVNGVLRREPSVDFLTAQAAGLRAMKDVEVLALAASSHRVLAPVVHTSPPHDHLRCASRSRARGRRFERLFSSY